MKTLIVIIAFTLVFIVFVPITNADILEYIPETSTITQGVYTEILDVNNDQFDLKIYPYNLPKKIFGISFDLEFDSEKIKFLSSNLNINNNQNEYLLVQENKDNFYSFAISAKKGHLLNLNSNTQFIGINFAIQGRGDSDICFSNVRILESSYDKKAITDKTIEAIGGTLTTDFYPESLTVAGSFFSPFIVFLLISLIVSIFIFSILFYKKLLIQKKNPVYLSGVTTYNGEDGDRIFRIRKIY